MLSPNHWTTREFPRSTNLDYKAYEYLAVKRSVYFGPVEEDFTKEMKALLEGCVGFGWLESTVAFPVGIMGFWITNGGELC